MFEIKVDVKLPAEGAFADEAKQAFSNKIERLRWRIQHVRCPVHGTGIESVTLVEKPTGGHALRYTPDPPCCEQLHAAALRAAADV